jgi:uncharacterized short protein YbdD (DUF466 family)
MTALRRGLAAVRWYVRELMGDAKYERYVAHLRGAHPDAEVPTERQFWRDHYADQDANPGSRCC